MTRPRPLSSGVSEVPRHALSRKLDAAQQLVRTANAKRIGSAHRTIASLGVPKGTHAPAVEDPRAEVRGLTAASVKASLGQATVE